MNRKKTALLLSTLVLPGLGQLYLGRKTRGIADVMKAPNETAPPANG